jgi:DNA-binding PadR family transcriptional regulator
MNKFSYIELAILRMLGSGRMHGYAMSAQMRQYSGGSLELPAGSLYPALHKLEKSGLISSRIERESGRKRRVYTITAKGEKVLMREVESWKIIVRTMNALLGGA